MDEPQLYDEKHLSDITGISIKTLQFWRFKGAKHAPRFIKVGRRVYYRPKDVDEWINERQTFRKSGIAKHHAY